MARRAAAVAVAAVATAAATVAMVGVTTVMAVPTTMAKAFEEKGWGDDTIDKQFMRGGW